MQLLNNLLNFNTLLVSHFEISGNLVSYEHPSNKLPKLLTFLVFQLEISGNSFNDEHPENNPNK